jgi:hypothetical protein
MHFTWRCLVRSLFILLAGLLAFPVSAFSQEIILKDGKKFIWKEMSDQKDSVNIQTPEGKTLTIQKAEIAKITVAYEPPAMPLTGASFTFGKKKTQVTNLLARVDPKRDTFIGLWKMNAGALCNSVTRNVGGVEWGRLILDAPSIPEEYDLQIVVERVSGDREFAVGLVAGDARFVFCFDAFGRMSGIWLKDGKGAEKSDDAKVGQFFTNGRPRTILIMVRKDGFMVQADGQDYYGWRGDYSHLSLSEHNSVPKKALFLANGDAEFRVRQVNMITLKE